jgi:hypothetical protein
MVGRRSCGAVMPSGCVGLGGVGIGAGILLGQINLQKTSPYLALDLKKQSSCLFALEFLLGRAI